MPSLLPPRVQAVIKKALKDVVDTFFKTAVTIHHRPTTTLAKYGEGVTTTPQDHNFNALSNYSVGTDGRYITIKQGPVGQELHDGWRIYLWKQDVDDVNLVIDPESDTISMGGKEYHFRFGANSAEFADLGPLLIELEIHLDKE